jgi:hypothetical protein
MIKSSAYLTMIMSPAASRHRPALVEEIEDVEEVDVGKQGRTHQTNGDPRLGMSAYGRNGDPRLGTSAVEVTPTCIAFAAACCDAGLIRQLATTIVPAAP